MRETKRVIAAALALMVAFSLTLTACDTQQAADTPPSSESGAAPAETEPAEEPAEEPEPEPEEVVEPDTVFAPLSPQRVGVLEDVIDWVQEEVERLNTLTIPDAEDFSAEFAEANEEYKDENYVEAYRLYRGILEECPSHPGALNNLVLTCLQMEQAEEALRYSLLSGITHPEFHEGRINLEVVAHALGLKTADVYTLLEKEDIGYPTLQEFFAHDFYGGGAEPESPLFRAWLYNTYYNGMECDYEIGDVGDPETRDRWIMQLSAGLLTEEELLMEQLAWWFDSREEILEEFIELAPDDADFPALLEYMQGLRRLRIGDYTAGEALPDDE